MKHLAAILLLLGATQVWSADTLTAITTAGEFNDFIEGYYKNPRPELVDSALQFLAGAGSKFTTDDDTSRMLQTAFACLFQRHPEKRDAWKKTIASLPEPGKTYLHVSMESDVNAMFHATPTTPTKNDMSWGCFFVTGDTSYIQDVILAMKHLDERKDLSKFLTGATAQWSLAALARTDDTVRATLETAAKGADKEIAAAANVALTRPVGEIRATTVEILKKQKEAGVWQ